jgi:hypothetical protein
MPKRDYVVGRGKPPVHSQFKKGQSGNPGGKPAGPGSFRERLRMAVEAALEQDVWALRQGSADKPLQKIANELVVKAAGGNQQALRVFLAVTEKLDGAADAAPDKPVPEADPTSACGEDGVQPQRVTLSEGNFQGNDQMRSSPGANIDAAQEVSLAVAADSGNATANAPSALPPTSP